jgi:hypothetical protein
MTFSRLSSKLLKAQAMFDLLKKYQWQAKDKTILFHESAQVKNSIRFIKMYLN